MFRLSKTLHKKNSLYLFYNRVVENCNSRVGKNKRHTMKKFFFIILCFATTLSIKAQKIDAPKKEYNIKYEVLTKKGHPVGIVFFDKEGKNSGNSVEEFWTYKFMTTDKHQNIQLFAMGGENASFKNRSGKVWVKVNIYVNDVLIKTKEDRFQGQGPTISVDLDSIK